MVLDTIPWKLDADENQARGRTGRQDNPGQYLQCWLCDDVKEAFEFEDDEWDHEINNGAIRSLSAGQLSDEDQKEAWKDFVEEKRADVQNRMVQTMQENNEAGRDDHCKTEEMATQLTAEKPNIEQLIKFCEAEIEVASSGARGMKLM